MAGDKKHARELIVCASNDLADAERCQRLGVTPSVGTLMRTLRQMIAAFEAALPGDDDWEYIWTRMRNPWFQEVSSVQDPHEFMRRFAALGVEGGKIERRVKAGPWQPWEPVEEVPRAEEG